MHYQFLIEDGSSAACIELLMRKLAKSHPGVTYDCKPFHGLGGFKKNLSAPAAKTGKLLTDLPIYLRGFDKSFRGMDAVILVVLDNDARSTAAFAAQLQALAADCRIHMDHAFCIAVEETEAWLLGDMQAVLRAYPKAKTQVLHSYEQDSICGTWEVLADAVYPHGLAQFRKDCPTFVEVGRYKSVWAQNIGAHMCPARNRSPSFQAFWSEIQKRLPQAK